MRVALGFLTTLPVPIVDDWRDDDLRTAVLAYPAVGLLLGLLLGVGAVVVTPLTPLVGGVLVTVLWLGLTGALHLDGLCDVADAALASRPLEQRWEIVRDPRVGTFGVAAAASLVLLKAAALAAVLAGGAAAVVLVVAVPVVARTVVVAVMARHPVHDASLLGRDAALPWRETAVPLALGTAIVVGLALLVGHETLPRIVLPALLAVVAVATAGVVAGFLARRLGGLGGDAYGAVVELVEAATLVTASALAPGVVS